MASSVSCWSCSHCSERDPLQISLYEAAQSSYVNPDAVLSVLGTASPFWLAWLLLQGVMIGCRPQRHPEKTTACVRLCVRCLGHAQNAHCSLEFSCDCFNLSEPKVGTAHTWTHTGRRSPFLAPHSSMLDTGCTQQGHKTQQSHGTAHACVCHVLLKPLVLTFSMPSCHFGRMRNSIVFHSRFGGK